MCALKGTTSDIITFTKANFHNVCRICFCDIKPPLLNIFSSLFEGEPIANIINTCFPKQPLDISLPNNICKDCLNHLLKCKAFISQFQYADILLKFVKDELNIGIEEVKINNLTKSNVLAKGPAPHVGKVNSHKKNGINEGSKPKADKVENVSKSSTNLNKKKSRSAENILLLKKQEKKTVFSLPLLINCNICKVDFLDMKKFQTHMKNTHPDKIIKCTSCKKDFFDADELKRHKIASHKVVQCRKCDSLVATTNINKHLEKIHKIEMVKTRIDQNLNITNILPELNCNDEGATVSSKAKYVPPSQHKQPAPSNNNNQHSTIKQCKPDSFLPLLINCNICKVDFLDMKIFQTHMKNTHPDKILKCNFCSPTKDFFDSEELKRHKITLHEFIKCRKCDSVVAMTNIEKHLEKMHKTEMLLNANVTNEFAEVNGNDEGHCKLHIIKTEKLDASLLLNTGTKCDHCSNSFQDYQSYTKHLLLCKQTYEVKQKLIKTELGASSAKFTKDLLCLLCQNISFPSYTKFEQHCSKQHSDTVSCNICQTNVLYSKEAYKLHRINRHGFVECTICLCIIKPEKMHKHMEIH